MWLAEEEEPLAKERGELLSPILNKGKKCVTSKCVAMCLILFAGGGWLPMQKRESRETGGGWMPMGKRDSRETGQLP